MKGFDRKMIKSFPFLRHEYHKTGLRYMSDNFARHKFIKAAALKCGKTAMSSTILKQTIEYKKPFQTGSETAFRQIEYLIYSAKSA
jgi:hypothetical protein